MGMRPSLKDVLCAYCWKSQVPPFKATLMEAMPYIDFLFGNETEAAAFAASESWPDKNLADIALRIAAFPKASGRRCRPQDMASA